MANIQDIAQEAGVGLSSVSRYLNQPEALKESTAKKIRRAMERLNYVPSMRRPGRKTNRRVGIKHYKVILLNLGLIAPGTLFNMPAYSLYIDALLDELNKSEISLELCSLTPDGKLPEKVSRKYCDGVILFQHREDRKFMKYLYEKLDGLPVVWSFNHFFDPESRYDKVIYDNALVGRLAADHFYSLQLKKVMVISLTTYHSAYADRVRDFMARARQLGMEPATVEVSSEHKFCVPVRAREAAEALMHNPAYREIEGIFFVADSVMTAVAMEYRALGGDWNHFRVLGCNANLQMLDFLDPIPPSIDIKLAGVGRRTALRLLERINAANRLPRVDQLLSPDIVTLNHTY